MEMKQAVMQQLWCAHVHHNTTFFQAKEGCCMLRVRLLCICSALQELYHDCHDGCHCCCHCCCTRHQHWTMLTEGMLQWPMVFVSSRPTGYQSDPIWGRPDTSPFCLILQLLLYAKAPAAVMADVLLAAKHAFRQQQSSAMHNMHLLPPWMRATDSSLAISYRLWFYPIAQMAAEGVLPLQKPEARNSSRADVLSLAVQQRLPEAVDAVS